MENLPLPLINLIRKKHEEKCIESETSLDIEWRVLNWKLVDSEKTTRSMFSRSFPILHVNKLWLLYKH